SRSPASTPSSPPAASPSPSAWPSPSVCSSASTRPTGPLPSVRSKPCATSSVPVLQGATDMNPDDTLPPVPPASGTPAAPAAPAADDGELWPSSGPAKGFRVRLPIAIVALVVVALAGAAAGASLKKTTSTTTQAGAIANRARGNFGATGQGAKGANG